MSSVESIVAPVRDSLERMRSVLEAHVRDSSRAVSDMTDHVGRFRGKQLRATLVLLAGDATGNSTDEHPTVAAIVEMIHLATLVHDDVLDGAKVRRRVACVNERWDNQTAVLLGDFLYARAFALSTDLSSRMASRVLAEATRRICVGEIDQAALRYDFEMPESTYERIAGAKTAELYAAACELGARYPGGREDLGRSLREYGHAIGLAFQIVDDCLDVVGKEEVVGKTVGNDVEDGKITLPVLRTYAISDAATRSRMRSVYTEPSLKNRLGALQAVVSLEAGVDYAFERARTLVEGAKARVRVLPPTPARDALIELGDFVLERNF
jgi:octaprenyl-diphosphate synthase